MQKLPGYRYTDDPRQVVLLLPFHPPSMQCHLVLARAMLADGRLRPLVLATEHSLWEQAAKVLEPESIIAFYAGQHYFPPRQGLAYRAAGKLLPEHYGEIISLWRLMANCLKGARLIMTRLRPVAVIGADDRKIGSVAAFWRLALDNGGLRLLVPFALTAGREDIALARLNHQEYFLDQGNQRLLKRWVAARYPGQVHQSPNGRMLFFSPSQIVAMGSLGMLPIDPWYWGGGGRCLVALSGQEELEHLTSEGLDPAQGVITGEPNHDNLFALKQRALELRAELAIEYGLDQSRPNLVWAVPQLAEHKLMGWDEHWREIDFLASSLAQAPANLLMSLHPKSDPERYRFLEARHGAQLLRKPLSRILPAADLFVATYSSTVRWAVMLHVPTVVVDFYGLDFKVFDHLGGVVKITDKDRLPAMLARLFQDPAYRQTLVCANQQDASKLAPFDGQANRRIINLILTSSHPKCLNRLE
ncbi:MAG: hypothetical protein V1806_07445 [Pseudomonadota bacterium]